MPSANAIRLQIEQALESRFPAARSPMPQTVRETAAVGIAAIDGLLSGGFPVGAISEISGSQLHQFTWIFLDRREVPHLGMLD